MIRMQICKMVIFVLAIVVTLGLVVTGWGGLINRIVGYNTVLNSVIRLCWEFSVMITLVIVVLGGVVVYHLYDFQRIIEWLKFVR